MKVFISYTPSDREYAKDVASWLAGAGIDVWWDQELLPGDNWAQQIGKALEQSDAMIVLLSPDSEKSDFMRRDLEYALGSPSYKGRVVPVVVRPTRRIPWILRTFPLVRLYEDPEEGKKRVVDSILHLAKAAG